MLTPRKVLAVLVAAPLGALLVVGSLSNVAWAATAVSPATAISVESMSVHTNEATLPTALVQSASTSICGQHANEVSGGSRRVYVILVPDGNLRGAAQGCFSNLTAHNSSFHVVRSSPNGIVIYGTGPLGTGYYGYRDHSSDGTPAVDINTNTFGNAVIHFEPILEM